MSTSFYFVFWKLTALSTVKPPDPLLATLLTLTTVLFFFNFQLSVNASISVPVVPSVFFQHNIVWAWCKLRWDCQSPLNASFLFQKFSTFFPSYPVPLSCLPTFHPCLQSLGQIWHLQHPCRRLQWYSKPHSITWFWYSFILQPRPFLPIAH